MPPRPLTRLRRLCLALPEAHEVSVGDMMRGDGTRPGVGAGTGTMIEAAGSRRR